jgi:hypothetical protein
MEKEKRRKSCFVISPIGDKDTPERRRSDQVLRHIIRPAALARGYDVVRADEIDEPGTITSQIIEHLIHDDLVIADLTGPNANVFYELAIRHAAKKPAIHMIEEGQRIPFDVQSARTIVVNHHDLDSAQDCRSALDRQIKTIEADPSQVDNPVANVAEMDLQVAKLESSTNGKDSQLETVLKLLLEIKGSMGRNQPSYSPDSSTALPKPVYLPESDREYPKGVVSVNHVDRIVSYDLNDLSKLDLLRLRDFLRDMARRGWRYRNMRRNLPASSDAPIED